MEWLSKHLGMLKDIRDFWFKRWLDKNASDFLAKVGLDEGKKVLDFGCGSGKYTISAAELVGESGTVYALDIDENVLDEVEKKAASKGLRNIERIDVSCERDINLEDMELDIVLLIDVLHDIENREELFKKFYNSLKQEGIVSVYPMHIDKEEVEEIGCSNGFNLAGEMLDGNILVFRKPMD